MPVPGCTLALALRQEAAYEAASFLDTMLPGKLGSPQMVFEAALIGEAAPSCLRFALVRVCPCVVVEVLVGFEALECTEPGREDALEALPCREAGSEDCFDLREEGSGELPAADLPPALRDFA